MKRGLQSLAAAPEQGEGTRHAALEPFKVGDPIPMVCGVEEMCRIFRVGRTQFYRRERRGAYRRFELPDLPGADGPKRWSGTRLARFLTNDSIAIAVKRSA